MSDLVQIVRIEGQDRASAILRDVSAALKALEKQADRTGRALKASLGADMLKPLQGARVEARAFGTDLVEAAQKAAKALKGDTQAVMELRTALQGAVSEQRAFASAARASQTAGSAAARSQASSTRNVASARSRAAGDEIRLVRQRWAIRDRSEKAELSHIRTVSRERAALRREAMHSARDAYRHGRHAVRSVNHPAFESIGHATALGAAFGAGAAAKIVASSVDIDSAAARYRMFAVPQGVDPTKATAEAVRTAKLDSIRLGMDASTLLDMQSKAIRDGVPAAIAKTLPDAITAAAKVMGGDPERLTDTLSEGVQQGISMGLMKTSGDVRRFLNLEAGLSNTAGNSSAKMEQFVSAGGLGRGKEMGMGLVDTMGYGALLNSSGMRTGQASARFMGQLSQTVPKMYDRFRQAASSRKNSEEDRAIRSAPSALGYGGIREMQASILSGPGGLIEFSTRLNKLNEKQRKLILKGYGFSEQGGAALAEIGASPEKAKSVLKRAKELAEQTQANDYLTDRFRDWQTSLANMLQQIEKGWTAIETEIGDVLKSDIIAPVRDWWTEVSSRILGSGMKEDAHRAIMAFIAGLGFADMRQALDRMSGNLNGGTIAGFAKGVGEGLRSVYDNLARLARLFGGGGNGFSAETIGRVAAEMLGLSLALRAVSPVLTVLSGVVEAIRAIGATAGTLRALAGLAGLTTAAEGAAGVAGVAGATALLPVTLAAIATGVVISAVILNWDEFKSALGLGKSTETPEQRAARPVKRLEDQSWWDFLTGRGVKNVPLESDNERAADKRKRGLLHRQSYVGGEDPNNWRNLLTRASYETSDSGDIARNAMVDTARGVIETRDAVDRLAAALKTASLGGTGGDGGGGGGGGALPNMRYGRGSGGAYRTTPGGGSTSGGAGGTRSWRNNNPGNISAGAFARAHGAIGSDGRFATFPDYATGRKAQEALWFDSSTYKNLTLAQAVAKWSPPSENDTAGIVRSYAAATGVNPNTPLSSFTPAQRAKLLDAQQAREGWRAGTAHNNVAGGGPGGASAKGQVRGNLKIGDETFAYGSGGAGGSASIPFGDYPINPDAPGAWGRAHNAMAVNGDGSIWDKSLGRMRTGIEMHEASTAAMVTHGCLGFMKGQYSKLKARVREMIAKTGHAYLHVGPNGATITPDKDVTTAAKKVIDATKPAEIAKKVHRSVHPGTGDARNVTADNSTVIHAPIHIHHADPHHVARTVVAHLDRVNSRYTDGDTVT